MIERAEKIIGYTFHDKSLLKTALTHSSYTNENGGISYERLEFLGDALVDFLAGEALYLFHKGLDEGKLTSLRKKAVCMEALAETKCAGELAEIVLKSKGLHLNERVRSDIFESVAAAIYLDSGLENARRFVLKFLDLSPVSLDEKREDYKSKLLEVANKIKSEIAFESIDSFGPDHDKTFVVAVNLNGSRIATAEGLGKKRAEQQAAKIALKRLSELKK